MLSRQRGFLVVLFLVVGLHPAFAEEATETPSLLDSGFATLSVGPLWHGAGTTQNITIATDIERTYAANNANSSLIGGELFVGVQRPLSEALQGQLGLALATTGGATLSGDIWEDTDPAFDNYTYQYQVKHTHVALKAKLLLDLGWVVTPWTSVSTGIGFNRAYGFRNDPKTFEAVNGPNFADNTTTVWTYSLALGLQTEVAKNWRVGLGFEFSDWGKSSLAAAPTQTTGQGLVLPHLYTSGFLFNVTYSL